MPPLKVTPLGELVYRHGSMTPPKWFMDTWFEAVKAADEDSEWELLLTERIAGLTEMRDRFYELMNPPPPGEEYR